MKKIFIIIITFVIISLPYILINHSTNKESNKNENIQNSIDNKTNQVNPPIAFSYEFNPHVISKEYVTLYGKEIEEVFYSFCDAVLNGESKFKCDSKEQFHIVLSIARVCLPIASQYVDKDKIYVENGIGYISYKIDRDELLMNVNKFKEKVTNIISSSVPYKEDDFIIAMELLTAVANKDEFDENGLSLDNALKWQPYRAIMDNEGICQEIAGEYIYYLLQVGINATTCSGLSKDKEFAHEWVVIELEGEHYHIDPTFTIDHKNSLAFFCLDDMMRERYGDFDMENLSYADSSKINYKIQNEKFKELWGAELYTIDHEKRKINMTIFYSGENKEYNY